VVDEVSYLPLSRKEGNYLFQLVSARYEKSSLILTSNKSFTEWNEILGDEGIAAAILDRLLRHSHVLSIRGQSYRLRDKLNVALKTPLAVALEGPPSPREVTAEMTATHRSPQVMQIGATHTSSYAACVAPAASWCVVSGGQQPPTHSSRPDTPGWYGIRWPTWYGFRWPLTEAAEAADASAGPGLE
jgi:hypothetical protein